MMKLEFRAYDKSGQLVCNVMDALSIGEAIDKLRQQNLLVAEIAPVGQAIAAATKRFRLPRGRIRKMRDLAMFTRQLHSLIRSGTQLAQGLFALERQSKTPEWKHVISDIRARVEQGSSLTEAMAAHSRHFDPVYRSMISAGESSGKLAELLDRLACMTRKRIHVLSTIRGAMIYPVLLACVGSIVMSVLLFFVVPRFATLFTTLGAPLPPTTALLIDCSNFVRTYWHAVIGAVAAGVLGLRYYLASATGKHMRDTVLLRLPQVGTIVKSFATAQIARLLGQLLDSHVPIQDVLRLTRNTTTNSQYVALLNKAEELVSHGEAMSSAFRDSTMINPAFYEAMHSGEQSGQVSGLLIELADFLDEENEITLKSLTSIIEPVMLVLMAVMVGFVAMSIFLPLFDVTSLMSGGK